MKTRIRPTIVTMAALLFIGTLLVACKDTRPSGPLEAPIFRQLSIPDPAGSNAWSTFSTSSPPAEVLPTRGRGVRVAFVAPVGSTFSVALRTLDGTSTPLTENQAAPAPPEAGYFQVISVNANLNPPLYTMYVRAPQALSDPANYDVMVVNRSLSSDVTDSAPMVVVLRQRKVFTVTVRVEGSGHVTSNPGGIQCGTASSGTPLTTCTFAFGPGQVSLAPNSNDPNTTRFVGWTGNCPPGVQVCDMTLTGMAPMSATATFAARTASITASTCPAAPALPGLRWINVPNCGGDAHDSHPGITLQCDGNGFFCCEPKIGASSSRCGGGGKLESAPDCRHVAPRGLLRQPGGCYEVDSFP
ncbi:MAG: hypothetical protein ABW034_11145 [Steroidobacteraceae bacterium]